MSGLDCYRIIRPPLAVHLNNTPGLLGTKNRENN
jgi:hypothetical protein